MGSISNIAKQSDKLNPKLADRISNLPNDVIGQVLSYLSTKEAVSTSILSSRWIDSWNLITNLDLDDYTFLDPRLCVNKNLLLRAAFINFVYRVLLLCRASCLRRFRLDCHESCYKATHVKAWIVSALRCGVRELDISIYLVEPYSSFPKEIFSSTVLTVLKLKADFIMRIPSVVSLPSLKIVSLSLVKFLDDDSLTTFIRGCPVLEELTLSGCFLDDSRLMNIDEPILKRQILRDLFLDHHTGDQVDTCKIVIEAPSILYIGFDNCFVGSDKLVEAQIGVVSGIWAHLEGISNVQSLYLIWHNRIRESWPKRWIPEYHFVMPEFPKLTRLEICVDHECEFLADFLESSPHLETLVYEEVKAPKLEQPRTFECYSISTSLKVVEMKVRVALKSCSDMVKCFLNNAKALEKLTIETLPGRVEQQLKTVNYFRKNHKEEVMKMNMEYVSSRVRWTLQYAAES